MLLGQPVGIPRPKRQYHHLHHLIYSNIEFLSSSTFIDAPQKQISMCRYPPQQKYNGESFCFRHLFSHRTSLRNTQVHRWSYIICSTYMPTHYIHTHTHIYTKTYARYIIYLYISAYIYICVCVYVGTWCSHRWPHCTVSFLCMCARVCVPLFKWVRAMYAYICVVSTRCVFVGWLNFEWTQKVL